MRLLDIAGPTGECCRRASMWKFEFEIQQGSSKVNRFLSPGQNLGERLFATERFARRLRRYQHFINANDGI